VTARNRTPGAGTRRRPVEAVVLGMDGVLFWIFVIGPLGALLAVPLSLFAKALLVDADPDSRWLDPLIAPSRQGNGDAPGREG
jgi:hypothetical protein